jgi:DNA-binding NtrC family response regulator
MFNHAQTSEVHVPTSPVRMMSILVLDDSEVDRKRLLRLCGDAGLVFTGTEAANTAEMRAALASRRFDLVFVDHMLSGEDGLDAVDMLLSDPDQSATLIMVAGEGRVDIAVEAMRRGCSDYLTKSELSVDTFRKTVASALERRIMIDSIERERARRLKLEAAVRSYANACSVEMRTILASALRRVRKLRSHDSSDDYTRQLGELEFSIDRLWKALPRFGDETALAITAERGAAETTDPAAPARRH